MMSKETLKSNIQDAVPKLIEMVKESCTNQLSDKLVFLVSEINDSNLNFHEERKIRIAENESKTPISFDHAIELLLEQYDNLYDINLYVHKAEKDRTIIDIRFYPKSALEEEYRKTVAEKPPMLHCKVAQPMYHQNGKFDVNWEHGGLKHRWKLFWYRKKLREKIAGVKNGG